MSYDIDLIDPATGKVGTISKRHIPGGTYAIGGTTKASVNITWNYGKHYYAVMGEEGIRSIYGMTGKESIPVLIAAINKLDHTTETDDYWEATEGNARCALATLLSLAVELPDHVWQGD